MLLHQGRFPIQHYSHVLGVVGNVGGQMQPAMRLEDAHRGLGEFAPDQSAFLVAGFGPGIGEPDEDLAQARSRESVQEGQSVTVDYADVGKFARFDL